MTRERSGDADLPLDWAQFEQSRWFGGKGRGGRCTAITPLDWYGPGPGQAEVCVRSEVATIQYPDGEVEDYQLLVSYRRTPLDAARLQPATTSPGVDHPELGRTGLGRTELGRTGLGIPHDALKDPVALSVYVDAIAGQAETPSWSAVVRRPEALTGAITVFGGEQSNTSVMVGGQSMVKLFRKLEHGHNLDIAVHDALGRAGVQVAARLHGWVEGHVEAAGRPPFRTDLAMVVEQLRDAKDGWQLATRAAHENADFTSQAAKLGTALAQVHRALADTFPAGRVEGSSVAAVMERRLAAAATVAPALGAHVDGLTTLFEGLRETTLNVQQIHGDFHLGQTLSTPGGWRIIDFEGEPMKTLAERQEPDSKWRDVAGMVRSISYATSGAQDPASSQAADWGRRTTEAFLNAYAPSLTPGQQAVLDAYVADKAIYEVVYETRNRPSWVHIPMRAIAALTERN